MKVSARIILGLLAVFPLAALTVGTACPAKPPLPSNMLQRKVSPQIQELVRQTLLSRPLGFEANMG